jgi:hypothetical protein
LIPSLHTLDTPLIPPLKPAEFAWCMGLGGSKNLYFLTVFDSKTVKADELIQRVYGSRKEVNIETIQVGDVLFKLAFS